MSSKKEIKKKAIYKYIYCDVFRTGVVVFIGDCESLRKFVNKNYTEKYVADLIESVNKYCIEENYYQNDIAARIYNSDSGRYIIHLPKFSFSYNINEISTMMHELLHATFLICDFIGIEYRYEGNNETYTYLQEFLLREALDKKGYNKV